MKASIAVAALGLVFAGAQPVEAWEVLGTATNKAGGELLMTDAPCGEKGLVIITSDPGGGDSLHGCASMLPPGRFYVRWDSGDTSVLSGDYFTRTKPAPSRRSARGYR
jgi:hypothetical protein